MKTKDIDRTHMGGSGRPKEGARLTNMVDAERANEVLDPAVVEVERALMALCADVVVDFDNGDAAAIASGQAVSRAGEQAVRQAVSNQVLEYN